MVTLGRWSQALEGVVYRVLKKPIVCFILFTLGGFQMIVLACDHLKGEKASKKALKKAWPSWLLVLVTATSSQTFIKTIFQC